MRLNAVEQLLREFNYSQLDLSSAIFSERTHKHAFTARTEYFVRIRSLDIDNDAQNLATIGLLSIVCIRVLPNLNPGIGYSRLLSVFVSN